MKILMLGWEFPPHVSGGLGTACHGMVRALTAQGAEIVFLAPRAEERVAMAGRLRMVSAGATMSPYGAATSSPRTARATYERAMWDAVERYASAARALATASRFDVVHAHDWMTYPAGLDASRAAGVPLVVHVHATEHDRSPHGVDRAIVDVERRGIAGAKRVVCVSRYASEVVDRHYRVDPRRLRVVHNGVVPPRLGRRRVRRRRVALPTVLFLGRVTAQKGPGAFLDVAARVLAVAPDVSFVMAGSGDLLPWSIERAAHLRISRRVRFPGFLRGVAVARAYASADVFVLPSVSEPFGIAPLEAMSMGVPSIVSSRSGVREVARHALVADPLDVDDLATKVLAVLERPRFARALSRASRTEARRLGWREPAARLLDVYREATS